MCKSVWARKGAGRRGFDAKGVEIETPKASRGVGSGECTVPLTTLGRIWGGVCPLPLPRIMLNFSFETAFFGAS